MTFVTLVLIEFFKAYSFRSDRHSVLDRPVREPVAEPRDRCGSSRCWSLVVNVPFLQDAFGTTSLSPSSSGCSSTGLAFPIVPVLEVAKWRIRRMGLHEPSAA